LQKNEVFKYKKLLNDEVEEFTNVAGVFMSKYGYL